MREFDGEGISRLQTAQATLLRIPFLESPYPPWHFTTGVVVETDLWGGIVPNSDELQAISEWLRDYNQYWYGRPVYKPEWPYDVDGGANLGYLLKRQDGDWCYRKRTWQMGPMMWPPKNYQGIKDQYPTMDLHELLDKIRPYKKVN